MTASEGAGRSIERVAKVLRILLTTPYGITTNELLDVVAGEGQPMQKGHVRHYLRYMEAAGIVTSEPETVEFPERRHGRVVVCRRSVHRYRPHPDLMLAIWFAKRGVFEAIAKEIEEERATGWRERRRRVRKREDMRERRRRARP
jgi:hypothetical protein